MIIKIKYKNNILKVSRMLVENYEYTNIYYLTLKKSIKVGLGLLIYDRDSFNKKLNLLLDNGIII